MNITELDISIEIITKLGKNGISETEELTKLTFEDLKAMLAWDAYKLDVAMSKKGLHFATSKWRLCPKCGSEPRYHRVENFDRMWGDGDVYCNKCDTRVRTFDSG